MGVIVERKHWMTADEFNEAFSLSQFLPGPNVIIVTLIGYLVTGIAGATDRSLLATAITIATAALAFFTRLNPLWMFVVAGLLGLTGWL